MDMLLDSLLHLRHSTLLPTTMRRRLRLVAQRRIIALLARFTRRTYNKKKSQHGPKPIPSRIYDGKGSTARREHTLLNIILLTRGLLSSILLLEDLSRSRCRTLRAHERFLAHFMGMCRTGSATALAAFGLRGTALFLIGARVIVVFAFGRLCRAAGDGLVAFAFAGFCRVAGDGQGRGHAGASADGGWSVGSGDASNLGVLGLVVYDGMLGCGVGV